MTSVETKKRSLLPIAWEGLVMGAATLAAIVIPARLVLAPEEQPLSLVLDAALTALFGVDLVLGDLYLLDQEAFDRTLTLYPDFAKEIRRISEERMAPTDTP